MIVPEQVVFLDPTGTAPDWLHVIVLADTGIAYEVQCGGTATDLRRAHGFLVPLDPRPGLDNLRELFESELGGTGLWAPRHDREDVARRVESRLAQVTYWSREGDQDVAGSLALDPGRLDELDEAWVPVMTPTGPGVLVWRNSD